MAKCWSVVFTSCEKGIWLEPYFETGLGGAQWHQQQRIKCPHIACNKEHLYSPEDFKIADCPDTL
jgi:hypothetical protein